MLTDDETRLLAHAYALRHDEADRELWFAPALDVSVEAHQLCERGYLDRWIDDDVLYRFSDKAMTAQELAGLTAGYASSN